jgi:hypothetical protein
LPVASPPAPVLGIPGVEEPEVEVLCCVVPVVPVRVVELFRVPDVPLVVLPFVVLLLVVLDMVVPGTRVLLLLFVCASAIAALLKSKELPITALPIIFPIRGVINRLINVSNNVPSTTPL